MDGFLFDLIKNEVLIIALINSKMANFIENIKEVSYHAKEN